MSRTLVLATIIMNMAIFCNAQVVSERSSVILYDPSLETEHGIELTSPTAENQRFVNGFFLIQEDSIQLSGKILQRNELNKFQINGNSVEVGLNGEFTFDIDLKNRNVYDASLLVIYNKGKVYQKEVFFRRVKDEKRVALVIGNSNYSNAAPLKNTSRDAEDMANTLRELNFEVSIHTDLDYAGMNRAVGEFSEKVVDADVIWFYYSGHGMEVDSENFLVPIDAKINSKQSVRFSALQLEDIIDALESSSENALNVIILDACRNNPFKTWDRSGGGGLAQLQLVPSGTLIGYSTAPGAFAADGDGQNGLYTGELIKQMRKEQRLIDVFRQTRIQVEELSRGIQRPWVLDQLTGEYYLIR